MERLGDLTTRMAKTEVAKDFASVCRFIAKGRADTEEELRHVSPRVQRIRKTAVAAGTLGGTTWGDDVSWQELTREWLTLLSSRTLLGKVPFRKGAVNTRTLLEDSPGSASWVAEGAGIPLSRLSLDVVQLLPSKIAGMCVFTTELMDTANPASLDAINRAMSNTIGRYSDQALVNPDIAAVAGKNPASLTNGAIQVASTGSAEAQVTANIKSLLQVHVDAGADLMDVYVCMHPNTALHLSQLLTAGNIRAYPNLGVRGGEIWGVPVVTSVGAVCSGSPTEKVIAAINTSGAIVADGDLEISASNRALVQMDDATTQNAATGTATDVVSLFQTGATAVKFIRGLTFARSHTNAVSYMRVTY